MVVAVVVGISGSGKTHIMHQLAAHNIPSVDTDDLVTAAYSTLAGSAGFNRAINKKTKPGTRPAVLQMCVNEGSNQLEKWLLLYRGSPRLAVVTGITIKTPADMIYFIKMSDAELETAYRRVIAREIQKVVENARELQSIVSRAPVRAITPAMMPLHIEAIQITTPFEEYKNMYKNAMKFERGRKAIFKTQAEIIKHLLSKQSR
jgi:hypothetical protein